MSLPAYTMGQVNLLDFSPIENALGRAMKQRQLERDYAMQQERMGMDRERLGFEKANFDEQQRRREELGRILDPTNPSFRDVPPQLVELSRATRDPAPIVQHYVNAQKGTDDIKEFEYARRGGFQGGFDDWMKQKRAAAGKFGLNPMWGTNERGERVAYQPNTEGGVRPIELPPGVKWENGIEKVDAGTHFVIMDKRSGQPVGMIPKNIAGAKVEEAVGEDLGKIRVGAPKMLAAQEAIERDHRIIRDEIDKTREISARAPLATGLAALLTSKVPGTTGYQVARLLDTIKARAGFDALGNMRAASPTGGALGAITERELAFLQSVMGSLEQVQSQEDLDRVLERLADYQESANDTRRRALEYDLKKAGVSPDLLNRQQRLAPLARTAFDTTKTPDGRQREFVGMQVDSRPGIPVAPQQAAPPAAPQPAPLPAQQRVSADPPREAIDDLMRNPSEQMKRFFEDHFKLPRGAADDYLKGRR